MKKFLCLVLCLLNTIVCIQPVYAGKEFTSSNMDAYRNDIEETRYYSDGVTTLDVIMDGVDTGKKLDVWRYPASYDSISLREVVEAMGGKIVWEPNYKKGVGFIGEKELKNGYGGRYSSMDEFPGFVTYLGYFTLFGKTYKFYDMSDMNEETDHRYCYRVSITTDIDKKEMQVSLGVGQILLTADL